MSTLKNRKEPGRETAAKDGAVSLAHGKRPRGKGEASSDDRAYLQPDAHLQKEFSWVIGLLPSVFTLLIILILLAWVVLSPPERYPREALWVLVLAGALAGTSFLAFLRQQLRLIELHQNILQASEGILDPVSAAPTFFDYSSWVAADYNEMILTLKVTFRTLDRCQSQVAQERNHVEALLHSFPGALLNIDGSLRIQSINKQSMELFSYFPGKLIGTPLFDLLQLKHNDREVVEAAIRERRSLINHQLCVKVDGRNLWYSIYLAVFQEPEQDFEIILVIQDISKFVQLQEAVSQRERFSAMGRVAAGVAHELNTPLGNILGYSQLLQEDTGNEKEQKHYIDVISDEARRCSRIVSDLLKFARRDKCDGETCDLNDMVKTMIESFISCRLRRLKVGLSLKLAEQRVIVEGSRGELEIVLTNLMENAVHALEKTDQPRIFIETLIIGKEALMTVSDNGPGVPEDIRQHIFEPFFTTKDIGSGSGLGLAITQAILNKRGASIAIDTAWEPGACFRVRLPAARDH